MARILPAPTTFRSAGWHERGSPAPLLRLPVGRQERVGPCPRPGGRRRGQLMTPRAGIGRTIEVSAPMTPKAYPGPMPATAPPGSRAPKAISPRGRPKRPRAARTTPIPTAPHSNSQLRTAIFHGQERRTWVAALTADHMTHRRTKGTPVPPISVPEHRVVLLTIVWRGDFRLDEIVVEKGRKRVTPIGWDQPRKKTGYRGEVGGVTTGHHRITRTLRTHMTERLLQSELGRAHLAEDHLSIQVREHLFERRA